MSQVFIPSPLYHLLSSLHICLMPPLSQNSSSETKKIRVHSPFLHVRLPQMLSLVQYVYRSHHFTLSKSETKSSLIPTSPPPVSSMTQTKKTSHPPVPMVPRTNSPVQAVHMPLRRMQQAVPFTDDPATNRAIVSAITKST